MTSTSSYHITVYEERAVENQEPRRDVNRETMLREDPGKLVAPRHTEVQELLLVGPGSEETCRTVCFVSRIIRGTEETYTYGTGSLSTRMRSINASLGMAQVGISMTSGLDMRPIIVRLRVGEFTYVVGSAVPRKDKSDNLRSPRRKQPCLLFLFLFISYDHE